MVELSKDTNDQSKETADELRRFRAEADAVLSAQQLRTVGAATILIDTSPQPTSLAARLAAEMGARYLPLPHVDAVGLSNAILGLPAFASSELSAP